MFDELWNKLFGREPKQPEPTLEIIMALSAFVNDEAAGDRVSLAIELLSKEFGQKIGLLTGQNVKLQLKTRVLSKGIKADDLKRELRGKMSQRGRNRGRRKSKNEILHMDSEELLAYVDGLTPDEIFELIQEIRDDMPFGRKSNRGRQRTNLTFDQYIDRLMENIQEPADLLTALEMAIDEELEGNLSIPEGYDPFDVMSALRDRMQDEGLIGPGCALGLDDHRPCCPCGYTCPACGGCHMHCDCPDDMEEPSTDAVRGVKTAFRQRGPIPPFRPDSELFNELMGRNRKSDIKLGDHPMWIFPVVGCNCTICQAARAVGQQDPQPKPDYDRFARAASAAIREDVLAAIKDLFTNATLRLHGAAEDGVLSLDAAIATIQILQTDLEAFVADASSTGEEEELEAVQMDGFTVQSVELIPEEGDEQPEDEYVHDLEDQGIPYDGCPCVTCQTMRASRMGPDL